MKSLLNQVGNEEGHMGPAAGGFVGAVGAVLLGIGAANDTGWLAIAGGIVVAVGLLAGHIYTHREVDYSIYERLNQLEK